MQYQLIGIVNRGGLEACISRHIVTPEGMIFTGYTTWQCLELSLYIADRGPPARWRHAGTRAQCVAILLVIYLHSVFSRMFKIFLLVPIRCVNYSILLSHFALHYVQVAEWHEMILNLLFQSSIHFVKYMSHFPRDNRHHQRPSIKRRAPGPGDHSGGLATNPGNN